MNQNDLCAEQLLLHFKESQLRWFGHLGRTPLFGATVASTACRVATGQDGHLAAGSCSSTSPAGLELNEM